MAGLRGLLAFAVTRGNESSGRYASVMLKFADDMLARQSTYRCGNCGFAGRRLIWQCPGCRKWGRFVYITDPS